MKQVVFNHPLVEAIADFVLKYADSAGKGNFILKAMWQGIRPEVPGLLKDLDSCDESVKTVADTVSVALHEELKKFPPSTIVEEVISDTSRKK